MGINQSLRNIPESFTVAFSDKVRRLKASGKPIIGLQTGDPNFDTPSPIVQAMNAAIERGETHYSNSRGIPELRIAIADYLLRRNGQNIDPDSEITITHGAVHAYHIALQAIINPGDQVLVPDPSWQTHANMVRAVHGEPVRVAGYPENQFLPTLDAWKAALSSRTTALVLNSPNNPTGVVAPRAYLEMINAFAEENDLYVISDEVYERLVYDDIVHTSFLALPDARQRTLLVNSFSKSYAMTGWRIGYLIAPANIINQALKASQYSITNVAAFIQYGAVAALTDDAVEESVQSMVRQYAKRRQAVLQAYSNASTSPIRVVRPDGAFYFFLDGRALGMPDTEISSRLLEEALVAVVPGSVYGERGSGFLRFTTAAEEADVVEGYRRIVDWAAAQ